MQQAKTLGLKGRYEKLDPAIHRAFNLPLMTRLSVGPDWQKLSPDQQKSLIAAFTDLSISTYAARFDGFSGEHFDVDPNPTPSSGGVVVSTKLVQHSGEPIQLNYLMREADAGWQILDVFLKGTISELATRRSEFSTVLRRDGAQALVQLIQNRAADLKKPA
jgi:phospholipid transport system substrate-binding protein